MERGKPRARERGMKRGNLEAHLRLSGIVSTRRVRRETQGPQLTMHTDTSPCRYKPYMLLECAVILVTSSKAKLRFSILSARQGQPTESVDTDIAALPRVETRPSLPHLADPTFKAWTPLEHFPNRLLHILPGGASNHESGRARSRPHRRQRHVSGEDREWITSGHRTSFMNTQQSYKQAFIVTETQFDQEDVIMQK